MFKSRAAKVALVLVLAFVLFGLLMGLILSRFLGGRGPRVLPASVLLHQVQTLSQLVTVKYVLEKVVILEDVKWIAGLGENKVLMVAHGTVKAGLDLSQLEPGDVKVSGKKVTLRLPKAQITDAYLDENETRVVERSTGLLRSFDKNLEQTARQNAVDDLRRAARNGGILKDADDRARQQLKLLFHALGYDEVEFESK